MQPDIEIYLDGFFERREECLDDLLEEDDEEEEKDESWEEEKEEASLKYCPLQNTNKRGKR